MSDDLDYSYLDGLTPGTFPLRTGLSPRSCAKVIADTLGLHQCMDRDADYWAFEARHRDDNGYWRYCLHAAARRASM